MASDKILDALQQLETRLTDHIDERLADFRLEMNARFDAIEARFDRLETEYRLESQIREIEARLDS